jgi:hypothetical protein
MKIYKIVGVTVMMGLAGCATNSYWITTKYQNPAESTTIESHVEGKATIGKVAFIYEKVFTFVNKELLNKK